MKDKYIIFDLDDTLTYEIDFLRSAYFEIALGLEDKSLYRIMLEKYFQKENVFEFLSKRYNVEVGMLLKQYRNHFPDIELIKGAKEVLDFCKENSFKLGLISDGRSVTQRNKLKSLKIENSFDKIVISEEFGSEKPNEKNYSVFIEDNKTEYFYVADNYKKDFVTPNRLGWTTIALKDSGNNIHKQNSEVEKAYQPKHIVESLVEVLGILAPTDNLCISKNNNE